jgi:putative transposase
MRHSRLPRVDLKEHSYFLTCCLEGRRPLFKRAALADALVRLYGEARKRDEIALHGYVVMPDHYHVVLTLRGAASISDVVRRVRSAFSRKARKESAITGRVWQRRFYDHVVRDRKDWQDKIEYIHMNPVRGGLVGEQTDYRWSSAWFWWKGERLAVCDPPLW